MDTTNNAVALTVFVKVLREAILTAIVKWGEKEKKGGREECRASEGEMLKESWQWEHLLSGVEWSDQDVGQW